MMAAALVLRQPCGSTERKGWELRSLPMARIWIAMALRVVWPRSSGASVEVPSRGSGMLSQLAKAGLVRLLNSCTR